MEVVETGSDGSFSQTVVTGKDFLSHGHAQKSSPGSFCCEGESSAESLKRLTDVILKLYDVAGLDYKSGQIVDRGPHFTVAFKQGEKMSFSLKPGYWDDRATQEKVHALLSDFHKTLGELVRQSRKPEK